MSTNYYLNFLSLSIISLKNTYIFYEHIYVEFLKFKIVEKELKKQNKFFVLFT